MFERIRSRIFPNPLEESRKRDLNVYLESKQKQRGADEYAPKADDVRLRLDSTQAELVSARRDIEHLNATLEKANSVCDAFRAENAALRQKMWEIAQAALGGTAVPKTADAGAQPASPYDPRSRTT